MKETKRMTFSQVTGQWFAPVQMIQQARFILFCFPYAGGGTGIFRQWSSSAAPDIIICPIQLPGRETRMREAAITSVSVLVGTVAEAISTQRTLPFALFGHSMGAFLGFEVARYLRSRNQQEPVAIFVSGQRAPHLPPRIPYPSPMLSDAKLVDTLRQAGGTSEAVLSNSLLMSLVLPSLRADLTLCANYRYTPGPPLQCPILAFGGNNDRQTALADLEAWGAFTTSSFRTHIWQGGHFFLHQEQEEMLSIMKQELFCKNTRAEAYRE